MSVYIILAVLLLALGLCFFRENRRLQLTELRAELPGLPPAFRGFRVAQISDFQNFPCPEKLLRTLGGAAPDIIVITGDLLDRRRTRPEPALALVREAAAIAPVYLVSGNHEAGVPDYPAFEQRLQAAGAQLLDGRQLYLGRGGEKISLAGLRDPAFLWETGDHRPAAERVRDGLRPLRREGSFQILLSHRPEQLPRYEEAGFDLVFSGHAHGGQLRLPGLGGLYAPGQGFFPRYTAGLYREGGTLMAVSRGLGNSLCPLRFRNPPELLLAVLERGEAAPSLPKRRA